MDEAAVRTIEALRDLPIVDEDDPRAQSIAGNTAAASIAEAKDMLRLHELLHRDEYKVMTGVRYRGPDGVCICVYFARLDDT